MTESYTFARGGRVLTHAESRVLTHAESQIGVPYQWPEMTITAPEPDDPYAEPDEDGDEPAYDPAEHDPDAEPEEHP